MSSKNEIVKKDEEHLGQVALPFNQEQFADFLISLLGKPQTISKRFEGSFSIDKDTISKLFEIINQRIYQQNDGKLIQFRATIYYSDNSSITLDGFEHLVNYNEALPLISEAIHLTWQYIVKFRDKDNPEKQEINVSFITNTERPRRYDFDDDQYLYISSHGQINIRINHTARTWGADIEALLSRHLEKLVKKDGKIKRFFRYNNDSVAKIIRVLILAIAIIHVLIESNTIATLTSNDIIKILSFYFRSALFIGLLYLFTIVIEFALVNFSLDSRPSYLLLTKESYKEKDKNDRLYKKIWINYTLTIIISIITGIISNYIFTYYINK